MANGFQNVNFFLELCELVIS